MRHTPLFEQHIAQGATMLNLKGVARPVEYNGHTREHLATRTAVTICDVSHMGELTFTGKDSAALLQRMLVGNVDKIPAGKVLYSAMCNEKGHVMDDLVLMHLEENRWLMVVNVTMIEQDYQWIMRHNDFNDAVVSNISTDTALIALQGPCSRDTLQKICRKNLSEMEYYTVTETEVLTEEGVVPCVISRTGYTGELGFEICCARELAPFIWRALMRAGRPFGIMGQGVAARESLRTEAGLLLNGNDMDGQTTPFEAGIGWIVDLNKEFVGKDALVKAKAAAPGKLMVGLELDGLPTMRYGYGVFLDGKRVGTVTSGPINRRIAGKSLGLAYVEPELAKPGQKLEVEILGDLWPVTVVKLPFIPRHSKIVPELNSYSPFDLLFLNENLWLKKLPEGAWALGITEYAANVSGECLYFKAPKNGAAFSSGDAFAWLDTYRSVFKFSLPASGVIKWYREDFVNDPWKVWEFPYCEGGLIQLEFNGKAPELMDFAGYARVIADLSSYSVWSNAKRVF